MERGKGLKEDDIKKEKRERGTVDWMMDAEQTDGGHPCRRRDDTYSYSLINSKAT